MRAPQEVLRIKKGEFTEEFILKLAPMKYWKQLGCAWAGRLDVRKAESILIRECELAGRMPEGKP